MNWDESFSVNNETIDFQHKRIIEMINELFKAISYGEDRQKLDEILVRLSVFTVKHFIYEESLFRKYGYENQCEHKKEHDYLSEQVTDFHKKHIAENGKIDKDRLVFFKDLLIEHIKVYDSKYVSFIYERGLK